MTNEETFFNEVRLSLSAWAFTKRVMKKYSFVLQKTAEDKTKVYLFHGIHLSYSWITEHKKITDILNDLGLTKAEIKAVENTANILYLPYEE